MITGDETLQDETVSKQEARAKLREGFLKAVSSLNGEKCSILTFEKSILKATFAGWNVEGHEFLTKDLKTPSVAIASALLRTPDILAVQFDRQLDLP